jgi:hypothetical protein
LRSSARGRLLGIVAACGVCLLGTPATVLAEWQITPMIGFTFAGRTTLVNPQHAVEKRHASVGGAVALLGEGIVGVEALGVFTPGFFQADQSRLSEIAPVDIESSRAITLMGNVVVTTPRRLTEYSLRPFVSAGLGLLHTSEQQAVGLLPPLRTNMLGYNVGGGAIGFLTPKTGVRFDLRYYSTLRGTDQKTAAIGLARLHYMTASVGVVWRPRSLSHQ